MFKEIGVKIVFARTGQGILRDAFQLIQSDIVPSNQKKGGSGHKVSDKNCFLTRLWSTMNHLVTM